MKIILFLLLLSPIIALADIAEFPDFYYWKSSFTESTSPAIVGKWKKGDITYSFNAAGTCNITNGKRITKNIKWKQRSDGKIYMERKQMTSKWKIKKQMSYVGYVKVSIFGKTFVQDQFCYQIKYSKTK